MLKQTTVYNVNLQIHAKFQKCHLGFDAVSAFSLVQGCKRSLLCYERLSSTRISNVARVSLERASVGGRGFQPYFGLMKF